MGVDYRLEYAEALAVLVPGEPVLAATVTTCSHGLKPRAAEPSPTVSGRRVNPFTAVLLFLASLAAGPGSMRLSRLFWWLLFGRAAAGDPQSTAATLARTSDTVGRVLLVVTARNVDLFEVLDTPVLVDYSQPADRPAPERRLRLSWHVSRDEVAHAEVGWYRLHPARLTMRFADGSWLAFADLTYMGRAGARRIAAEINASGDGR